MDEVDKVELNRPLKKPEKAEKTDRTHAQQLKLALLFFAKSYRPCHNGIISTPLYLLSTT